MIAKIAVSAANFAIDKPYSYLVPEGMALLPGQRVQLPFGRGNTRCEGVVLSVEEGTGPVLLGEVSQCNDDNTDNRFSEPIGRFPTIEEDEAPYRLLCNEYPAAE